MILKAMFSLKMLISFYDDLASRLEDKVNID